MARRLALLCFAASMLTGCATPHGRELPAMRDWDQRREVLLGTDRWEFQGRIGVKAGAEGFNGKLWWWQRDQDFRATVSGPLGVGTLRIAGLGSRVTVTDQNGTVTEMQDAEADLRAMYGWTIPVESLRYWALGVPDPASPAVTEFGGGGELLRLEQRGWLVEIPQYRDAAGQSMPRRILAVNEDASVRLVIDNWVFY